MGGYYKQAGGFGDNEPGLPLRCKLYQVAQKEGGIRRICGMGIRYGGEGISFLRKNRGRIICGRVLSQSTQNKRTSLAVWTRPHTQ